MKEKEREIHRKTVNGVEGGSGQGLGTEMSCLFAKAGLDQDIAELRGSQIKPASFER